MMRKISVVLIYFLFITVSLSAEQYSFSSDFLKSVMAEGKEKTLLEGNVQVNSEKKKITADRVEILGKDFQFFICEGNVQVVDLEKDFTLSSEVFHYDNDNRIIRINGPSMMEDRENEMIIKCSYLENREKDDLIIMQVGVRILKEDLACRSEFAVYDRKRNTLELTGLPVVYRKDDVFRASRITVNLDNDEISMEGVVQGSLLSKSEDDNDGDDAEKPVESADE
jgi:lipopolysaccharide export system protein LptA